MVNTGCIMNVVTQQSFIVTVKWSFILTPFGALRERPKYFKKSIMNHYEFVSLRVSFALILRSTQCSWLEKQQC